ncbi:MAG: phage holin family protein [Mangrovibacterium sp.]
MKWFLQHILNLLSGLLMAIVGYFAEIKGVVNVMVVAIVLDLILGIWAARVRGEGIQSKKLWRTAYKMLISLAVVMLLYAADHEIGLIELHKAAALLIIGFEIWSMLESAGQITDHKIFRILKRFMEDRVEKSTGVNINEEV